MTVCITENYLHKANSVKKKLCSLIYTGEDNIIFAEVANVFSFETEKTNLFDGSL